MPTTKTAPKSTDLLTAAGYDYKAPKYAGKCVCCGTYRTPDHARIIKPKTYTHGWELICKRLDCAQARLAPIEDRPTDEEILAARAAAGVPMA